MNNRAVAILALFMAIGISFVYIAPTWNGQIAETKAAIKGDDDALAAAQQYKDRERELLALREAIDTNDLAKLQKFLPDSVDNVGLILDLNALASRSGFSLSNIDVSEKTTNTSDVNPIGSVDMTLSGLGTYNALQKFMKGIELSQRLIDVRDLSISGSNTGIYNYNMTLRIYWLR